MAAETIFALSTPPGIGGVAIVRVSGPKAGAALAAMAGAVPEARRATRVRLGDPASGEMLDDGLALWFPAPHSFTGEDVVELHVHGGRAVAAGLLEVLGRQPGLRLAEAGEFTRRAFVNGKLDLTAAEGLADVIAAETAAQRRQALRQLDGALGRLYDDWRDRLLHALAIAEASFDFADDDLPDDLFARVAPDVAAVAGEIAAHLDDDRRGERLRDGVAVAIVGPPNAGKSSLLNRLARRDVAIVHDLAGTTRDVIEVHLDLGGYPVTVADTAGLRSAAGPVEAEGVRRARDRAARADLVVAMFDATALADIDEAVRTALPDDAVLVINKCDLVNACGGPAPGLADAVHISCKTGAGFDELLGRLTTRVGDMLAAGVSAPHLTRARHRTALAACHGALARFAGAPAAELAAEDLRSAVQELARITGRVDVEDILDVIFSRFCIGK